MEVFLKYGCWSPNPMTIANWLTQNQDLETDLGNP